MLSIARGDICVPLMSFLGVGVLRSSLIQMQSSFQSTVSR